MCVSVSVLNKIYKTHRLLFLEFRIILFSINSFTISMKFNGKYPISHTDICGCVKWKQQSQVRSNPNLGVGMDCSASLVAQLVKNPPAMQETWIRSLGWEDPLEEGPLQHSCLENPHGQRSLMGYSLWGCKALHTTEWLSTAYSSYKI